MEENKAAKRKTDTLDAQTREEELDEMLEEIEIEDLTVDGICGVY